MKRLQIIIIVLLLLRLTTVTKAVYDPRTVPNNQYGIHIVDPTDLNGVTELINSSGGEWGYIKVVIPENDRNADKWDAIFREFRRRKLIPIVRLATRVEKDYWVKPTEASIEGWPSFLNELSWPTSNRYVVLFNEPNHAKEWGNSINPEEYGALAVKIARSLKQSSPDYFILPAGLDVSAASNNESLDAELFLKKVVAANPTYLSILDGWNSHSYPNPAFSAPPTTTGRGSLFSFDWELGLLRSLGETRNLPVLIGETGWRHAEGTIRNNQFLSTETVANYYELAAQTVWRDARIFAVIPFLYNYQGEPFAHFSFRAFGGVGYYPHYFRYLSIPKQRGKPIKNESYLLLNEAIPSKLIAGSSYTFPIELKNVGQAIISAKDNYSIEYVDPTSSFSFATEVVPEIEPDNAKEILITINSPLKSGTYTITVLLKNNDQSFLLSERTVTVLPPPTITLTAQLGWQRTSTASNAAVLIYDGDTLIYKFEHLKVLDGMIVTPGVLGIVPDRDYRIVTLIDYYLPRQMIHPINEQVTFIQNKRFLPFDTNRNQQLDWGDAISLLQSQPAKILPRFFGN